MNQGIQVEQSTVVISEPLNSELTSQSCALSGESEVLSGGRWFVLHTLSRQEKALAADLLAMDIVHYLPLVSQIRHYGKRKVKKQVPLFPGYLFLRGSHDQAYQADRTGRVARLIEVVDQARLDRELSNLRKATVVAARTEFESYPYLEKGVYVEVRSGPLKGVEGMIEDRSRGGRLILQVEILGKATSLELDGALLERIEPGN